MTLLVMMQLIGQNHLQGAYHAGSYKMTNGSRKRSLWPSRKCGAMREQKLAVDECVEDGE